MRNGSQNSGKRIAIFGSFLSSKGYNKSVCEALAEKLKHTHWNVITASNRLDKIARLIDMMVTAWKERRHYEVAAVEVYSGLAFVWAEAVCFTLRLAKKPYVLTLHGGNLPKFSEKWAGRVKKLLNSAQKVTTPSSYLYEEMKPIRDDLLLIPNAIDIAAYTFCPRRKVRPQLLWLRSFRKIYNPTLASKVIKLLSNRGLDVRLTMIGPDMGDGSFQEVVQIGKKLGVLDRIDFPGGIPKTKVPEYMKSADFFINTTNFDNTPISVIEAMACGLCIVSTNVGGIPYLLENRKDALLVPPNQPEAMANAICHILSDPNLAERLSSNARAAVQKFDWSVVLPHWESLLDGVLVHKDIS